MGKSLCTSVSERMFACMIVDTLLKVFVFVFSPPEITVPKAISFSEVPWFSYSCSLCVSVSNPDTDVLCD